MSKRLKKIITAIFTVLLILAGTAFAALYYMGDRIVEEAIRDDVSLETTENGQAGQSDESNKNESNESQGTAEGEAADSNPAKASTEVQQQADGPNNSSLAGEKASNQTYRKTDENIGEKNTSKKKTAIIAETKIAEIKSEVTAEDKISAAALILRRLSTDDINELKNMLAGGLSAEEKEKAKKLAYSRFTSEEIDQIKEMYEKYMY